MILQLQPCIRVETPLGAGLALFYEDDGQDIFWTVAVASSRAIVQFRNEKIRIARCYTAGLGVTDAEMRNIIAPSEQAS